MQCRSAPVGTSSESPAIRRQRPDVCFISSLQRSLDSPRTLARVSVLVSLSLHAAGGLVPKGVTAHGGPWRNFAVWPLWKPPPIASALLHLRKLPSVPAGSLREKKLLVQRCIACFPTGSS